MGGSGWLLGRLVNMKSWSVASALKQTPCQDQIPANFHAHRDLLTKKNPQKNQILACHLKSGHLSPRHAERQSVSNNSGQVLRKCEAFFQRKASSSHLTREKLDPAYTCLGHNGAGKAQAATENQHNKMQNYCKTIGALAAASALVAGNAQANVEYELHTGYTSEYLFRGINLGDDLIEVGADVKTEWNGIGLSAGAWYGTGTFLNTGGLDFNELDLYAGVSKDFGFVTGSIGYISRQYDLNNLENFSTQEISFGLSRDLGFATVSLTYNWCVDGADYGLNEGYTELALRRSFELSPCLSLNVGTNVGYLMEEGAFTAWTTKVALDWGFAEHAKLSPFVALGISLGQQSDTIWWVNTKNELIGGGMLSVNF